jgi:hypothetical protein
MFRRVINTLFFESNQYVVFRYRKKIGLRLSEASNFVILSFLKNFAPDLRPFKIESIGEELAISLGRSLDGMVGDLYFRILLKRSCCYLDWQRDVERTAPRFRISSLQE